MGAKIQIITTAFSLVPESDLKVSVMTSLLMPVQNFSLDSATVACAMEILYKNYFLHFVSLPSVYGGKNSRAIFLRAYMTGTKTITD